MSDLNPKGQKITLGGEDIEFLFTLNVIDEIQSETGKSVFEALRGLTEAATQPKALKLFVRVLYNDYVEFMQFKNKETKLKTITDKQAGWLITPENVGLVVNTILRAYGLSIPEPDGDEDSDPNSQSE